jgi:CheY-like chemotaxis protein
MSNPGKILLAGDSEIILKVPSNILESEGFTVNTSQSGLDALKQALQEKPDLIKIDKTIQ